MEASEVSQVVDKLAEKIGVAADKLAPLGAEAVRQVSMVGLVQTIVFGVACAACMVVGSGALAAYEANEDVAVFYEVVGGVSVVMGLLLLMPLYYGLSRWLAPIPWLIRWR